MNKKEKNTLIISAHADDHIACAGTVLKLKTQGFTPYEVVLTNSQEGIDKRGKVKNTKVLRAKELSKASQFLGIEKTFILNQEDLGLIYSKEIMLKIVKIIREVKPKIGLIMNNFDWHPDHRESFKIASEAFKWAGSGVKPELGNFHKTPIVLCAEGMIPIKSAVLVDVSNFAIKKVALWNIYESQASSKAKKFEEGLLQVRGYQIRKRGENLCEAFSIDPLNPIEMFNNDI